MTTSEITEAIKAKLAEAGIHNPGNIHGDDSTALVTVYPEREWTTNGVCFIGIWESYVQKYQRNYPFNFTKGGALGEQIPYNTPDEMIEAVKKLQSAERASCWK
jgi:hypothetical protein